MSDYYPGEDKDFYRVGPFFDTDGEEILLVGDEAVEVPLDRALGHFHVRSLIDELHGREVIVSGQVMTAFMQQEWDRMWSGTPSQGFLFAYQGSAAAAGRLAEEVILRETLQGLPMMGATVERVLSHEDAMESGVTQKVVSGIRSDDLVLLFDDGRTAILESKSRYTKSRYLSRSRRKAVQQLRASLAANSEVDVLVAALVDLRSRVIEIAAAEREEFLASGLVWLVD